MEYYKQRNQKQQNWCGKNGGAPVRALSLLRMTWSQVDVLIEFTQLVIAI